jgi:predicted RecA/RadA family phage recombinase
MLVLVGSIVGVAAFDAASGASVELALEGIYTLNKTSALAITAGDLLYLDDTNHVVNKTNSQKLVGVAARGRCQSQRDGQGPDERRVPQLTSTGARGSLGISRVLVMTSEGAGKLMAQFG